MIGILSTQSTGSISESFDDNFLVTRLRVSKVRERFGEKTVEPIFHEILKKDLPQLSSESPFRCVIRDRDSPTREVQPGNPPLTFEM